MAFHDTSLPDDFQYGSQFGAGFATVTQQTASGHEYRIARQAAPRHRFRLRKMLQDQAELAALKAFVIARRGALHSFRLKDWSDYTTNEDGTGATTNLDVALGTGDGSEDQFQLVKTYDEAGAGEYDRVITLPVAGSIKVAVAAAAKTEGTHYNVTNPGGVITFTAGNIPTSGQEVTAGFEFDVPARFELSVDDWNAIRSDAFEVWSLADLGCIEVLNEVEYPELWYPGGGTDWGNVTGNVAMSLAQGALHRITPDGGSYPIDMFLPAPPTLFPGGPEVFTISVESGGSGSPTVQIRDDAGNAVGSAISTGTVKRVGAFVSGGNTTWILY